MTMDKVKFKGDPVSLLGELPEVGDVFPEFTYVTTDLKEVSSYDIDDQVLVILAVPSLDTGVCIKEARTFNASLSTKKVRTLIVSKDLPFALKRACTAEGLDFVEAVSDFRYDEFAEVTGAVMIDGPLKGLLARAVFILKDQTLVYSELVPDITMEPDYDKALKVLEELV